MKVDTDEAYMIIESLQVQIISDVDCRFFDSAEEECRVCSILDFVISNDGEVPAEYESTVKEYFEEYGVEVDEEDEEDEEMQED